MHCIDSTQRLYISLSELNLLFWSLHIESLEQYTSLANLVAGHEAAFLTFLLVDLLLLLVDLDAFSRVDDVDD